MRNLLVYQHLLGFFRSHFFFLPLLGLLSGYAVFAWLPEYSTLGNQPSISIWAVLFLVLSAGVLGVLLAIYFRGVSFSTRVHRGFRSWCIYCLNVGLGYWVLPPQLPSYRIWEVFERGRVEQVWGTSDWMVVDCVDSVAKEARVNGKFWVKVTRWRKDSEPWLGPLKQWVMPRSALSEFEHSGIPEDTDWPMIFGSKGYYGRLTWPIKRSGYSAAIGVVKPTATEEQAFDSVLQLGGGMIEKQAVRDTTAGAVQLGAFRVAERFGLLGNYVSMGWSKYLSRNGLLDLRLRCLDWLRDQLRGRLSPQAAAMAIALLVGETKEVDSETVKAFGVGGLMHVLAVSGMHVALVMGAILWVFTGFGRTPRPTKVALLILMVIGWFYTVLTGGSAAVVRAMLSASWMWLAKYWVGKRVSSLHVWLGCAYIQLLLQPYSIYNLGFVLSYLAVLSLLIFYPVLRDFWLMRTENFRGESRVERWMRYWIGAKKMDAGWQLLLGSVAMNVAATLFTFPLIMGGFGTFPVWFLPVNLLLVPLFTILLYAALIVLIFGWIPLLGNGLGMVVDRLYSWVLGKLLLVLELPFSQLFSYHWDWVAAGLVFLLIVWVCWCLWLEVRFGNRVSQLWTVALALILVTGVWIEVQRMRWAATDDYFSGRLVGKEFWGYKRKETLVISVKRKVWTGEKRYSGGVGSRGSVGVGDGGWDSANLSGKGWERDVGLKRWERTLANRNRWERRLGLRLEKYRLKRGVERVRVRW